MRIRGLIAAAVAAAILVVAAPAGAATFTPGQKAELYGIAHDTWQFYGADVDPVTHLPLDNLGPGSVRGEYTSAANVGVYLWAVVAAHDLGLISESRADQLAGATLHEVAGLKRYDGFMYQWYDTNNGNVLSNPGEGDCTETTPDATDNCWFVSAVDNGWYATGLIEVKQALPAVRGLADSLLKPMDFSIFYDNRPQTDCNVNASLGGQPTGPDVRRLLRRPGSGRLPQRRAVQRSADRDVHRDGAPPDARRRVVAVVADRSTAALLDRPGAVVQDRHRLLAHLHRPAVGQAVPGVGGPLHLPGHLADVRADVRRRDVRGADGEPGRARDDVGSPQLRARRPALGPGPG